MAIELHPDAIAAFNLKAEALSQNIGEVPMPDSKQSALGIYTHHEAVIMCERIEQYNEYGDVTGAHSEKF